MNSSPQSLKFTPAFKEGETWINPENILFMETGEKKEKGKDTWIKYTLVHFKYSSEKAFIKEHPEEVNRIARSIKRVVKKETTYSG